MPDLPPTDPAARLLNVLRPLVREARTQQGTTKRLGACLGDYFGLSYPADTPELLRKTSLILGLPAQYRVAMAGLPIDPAKFTDRLSNVEKALSRFSLTTQVKQVMDGVDDTTINQLEMSQALLTQYYSEPSLTADDESEIDQLLSDLEDTAFSSGLSEDAQDFVLRHMRRMREALLDARIVGVQPVQDAAYTALGEVAARGDVREDMASKDFKGFWAVLAKIFLLTQVTHMALGLPADAMKALGAGSDPTPIVVHVDPPAPAKP